MFEIEDIALQGAPPIRTGITETIAKLKVGQSFYASGTYYAAYARIRQAKMRKTDPVQGEFKIVIEGKGVRIGRTS